ncbi:MAG: ABC transporter permease [Dehalococcoidales bacterium]|nr:ABC transporter permease [Dehalococcoidales bacterium]
MRNILTISKREITRLRTRFRGRSRVIILLVIGLAAFLSYFVSQQGFILSKEFYTIGAGPDAPTISDTRFNVVTVDRITGYTLLAEKKIDVYINGGEVVWRKDERRSLCAAGALKQFLEKQELSRIANKYELDRAFPLRVEVHHVELPEGNIAVASAEVSFWDLLEPADSSPESGLSPGSSGSTDSAVLAQLEDFRSGGALPEFKAEFVSDEEIIIPSLMDPPIPLAQVMLAFFYVVPIFFISIFFTSSFMEEKINRKLVVLLSTPVTPFQIIVGKMLPYIGYSVISIIVITLLLKGSVPLALAIFVPIMLFILSIYLMVSLLYRTFKDQTFFSLLAVSGITIYLIFPSMFSGISDLSYISPLNLAVEMYKGETFGLSEYLLSTTPMYLIFGLGMFIGTRVFNEEYLMGFRPLHRKLGEALHLTINKRHPHLSIFLLSIFIIPAVFMVQLASIAIAFNLPIAYAMGTVLVLSVVVEEIAKSAGIAVLLQNGVVKSTKAVITLSFVAALGFFAGEKLLLYVALKVISESMFTTAIFGSGLLIMPLLAHFIFTSFVCLITARFGVKRYPLAIIAGSVLHILYNLTVVGVLS